MLVVGGGVMGASVAYHTALADPSLRVCVVERDTSYAHASAMLSAGGIRQQFSLPVNIQLSLYGVDFLRRLGDELQVPGSPPPDAQFKEQGYLFLASAQGEATLRRNQATQLAQGVSWTRLLSPDALRRRFPWLKVDGVALGCVGEHSEGWFDPWALLSALRAKAAHLGVHFVSANVEGLEVAPEQGELTLTLTLHLHLPLTLTLTLSRWHAGARGPRARRRRARAEGALALALTLTLGRGHAP